MLKFILFTFFIGWINYRVESGTNILNETDIIFRFGLDRVLDIRVRVNTAMNIGYRLSKSKP